ncbi:MAG: hypothetical protein EPO25_16270 [Gammaproteobacteria bacterium]|nr:MAG: hypothetical protein EPO25_16270 [Gammaproteobacteria bacterium]
MSSSYPDNLRAVVAAALGVLVAGPVLAAQTYVVPRVELRAEHNDNFGLAVADNPDSSVFGIILDAEALIGIATPRSQTTLRPRVRLQEYPDLDDLELMDNFTPVEAYLDLRSTYRWQRANLEWYGRFQRQDSYNVENPGGAFDPLDPGGGDTANGAGLRVGETRTQFQLRPTFQFQATERTQLGLSVDYGSVNHDSGGEQQRLDYDHWTIDGFVTWKLSPLSELTAGAYLGKYETEGSISETETVGGQLGFTHRWSEATGIEAVVFHESSDVTDFVPVRVDATNSGWGATVTGWHQREVSVFRFSAGRRFVPSDDARRAEIDQFRLQYDRNLSQRLAFKGALRYETRNSPLPTARSDDRDYARADLSLEWRMTEKWYLGGGYSYIWNDREQAAGSASNNKLFIAVGYRGLAPPR